MMKSGWQWPVLISAALLFTVGVNVVMLFAAGGDPNGTVVEPDYYRKAVEWDRTMQRRAASDRLGWQVEGTFDTVQPNGRDLTLVVRDADGTMIRDAIVDVTLIHNAEAHRRIEASLMLNDHGEYRAAVPAIRAGRWEVRIEARRAEARFQETLHLEAP